MPAAAAAGGSAWPFSGGLGVSPIFNTGAALATKELA
jgi:hypothetical protein